MSNLLQSSQTQATSAPGYYTDYLADLAQRGRQAQQGAQFVGAQPLQTQAFQNIGQTAGQFQPMVGQGAGLVQAAGGQDITGAAQPFLAAGTATSPLAAMAQYAQRAGGSPAELAQSYMNPFVQSAVQSLSDIAQRNIRQNLSPAATAAAVGSGQYGSQRGAQVLGQIQQQAQQDLNSQIAQMLTSGYGQALQAAGQQQALQGQLAGTASQAQQAGNLAQLQAAQTAAQSAAQQAQARQAAGLGLGTLAGQGSGINLANINALATLGGQQQTIAQNEQMFPLTTLSNLAGLLQGYQMPTTVTTQLEMSPLSAIGAIGSGLGGLFQAPAAGSGGTPGKSLFEQLTGHATLPGAIRGIGDWFGGLGGSGGGTAPADPNVEPGG